MPIPFGSFCLTVHFNEDCLVLIADVYVVPVVCSHITPIIHASPLAPARDGLCRLPDALAEDDVLDVLRIGVVHDPFGDLDARERRSTTAIRAHKVDSAATAVIRGLTAAVLTDAVHVLDPAGELGEDRVGALDGHVETARLTERGLRVPAEARGRGATALHRARPGALAGHAGARAVARPAAVTG